MMLDQANAEPTPEERAELELRTKLEAARSELITYGGNVFFKRGWRVRVTADWSPEGALVIRCEPPIDNYAVTVSLSKERLLEADQSKNHEELDALPDGMIDAVFGGSNHVVIMGGR